MSWSHSWLGRRDQICVQLHTCTYMSICLYVCAAAIWSVYLTFVWSSKRLCLCWHYPNIGIRAQNIFAIYIAKNLLIECAQDDRPARCPNHFFAVNEPSAVPWWWCDLFWNHEIACGVRWSNVVGCEVTWGELLWLFATWHVMSCHLMWWSCHLMPCGCLCCVMSRDAMRCHVMCAHVMSCHLLCPARNVMSVRRRWLWGHVVWFEVVLWQCGDPKVFFCTTLVLLQYYSVLQSTAAVLLSTIAVLLCTTKYYCTTTTTLYHKVLLQYYSYPPHHWPYSSDLGGDFELKNATFGAPAIPQNFTKCWACNEKSHSTFTKYCACHAKNESHDWSASHMKCHWQCAGHQESASNFTKYSPAISQNLRHVAPEKWHSDITKCCPCHEKWHYNITKCCACHESSHSHLHQVLRLSWKMHSTLLYASILYASTLSTPLFSFLLIFKTS